LWWARDDTLSALNLDDFIKKGLVEKALDEKHQAVEMWKQIEDLSRKITFADADTNDFVTTSASYGRIKYAIIEQGWTILFYGNLGDSSGSYDRQKLLAAIDEYDRLWKQWQNLKATHPTCSTLAKDQARGDRPGMGAAVEHYRKLLNTADTTSTDRTPTAKRQSGSGEN